MDVLQFIALVRDVVLILSAGMAFIAMVAVAVVLVLFYRKVSPLLDSATGTVKRVEELSTTLTEHVVKPLRGGPWPLVLAALGRLFRRRRSHGKGAG